MAAKQKCFVLKCLGGWPPSQATVSQRCKFLKDINFKGSLGIKGEIGEGEKRGKLPAKT